MDLCQTGLRSGEHIIASFDATQNWGTVMQVRFPLGRYYPPSLKAIEMLDSVTLRDRFRDLPFSATRMVNR